ncbi:MAG: beta-hexosaminidase [Paracoccaceae bacterium]|nr:beta-hexosaminidase [Paracoccaceae bacterium]
MTMKTPRGCIFGCSGPELTAWERAFFSDVDPWGFILFTRNANSPDQLRKLTADLRATVGRDAPVFIDQEGGRVARLVRPHWREWLPPLYQVRGLDTETATTALTLRYRLIAAELRNVGIDANCAPLLDLLTPFTHDVIRNRCLSDDPETVSALGRAVADGLLAGGVLPVMKHIPGHGRARQDSHEELPVVDAGFDRLAASDFVPFASLSDLPIAMTAHVLYPAIDPDACATLSPTAIEMIRDRIGFDGLLMTDDLSMKALSPRLAENARQALSSGCDILLHCNGDRNEMRAISGVVPRLSGPALGRANRAIGFRGRPEYFEPERAERAFDRLVAGA